MTAKDIFRWIGVISLLFLLIGTFISALIIISTLFSGNLGKVVVGIIFFAYVLFFSYSASLLAFWASYWDIPRWVNSMLIISVSCGFLASLVLIPLAINADSAKIFLSIPPILFAVSIYRFFKKRRV